MLSVISLVVSISASLVPFPLGSIDAKALFKKAEKSIVIVQTSQAVGTGVSVLKGKYVLTAAHVVASRKEGVKPEEPLQPGNCIVETEPSITANGGTRKGYIVSINFSLDLAVIEMASKPLENWLSVLPGRPEEGSEIVVIGNALGVLTKTITSGIVSGVRESSAQQLLQHTAPTAPGVSGAPLINAKGEVVGLHVSRLDAGSGIQIAVGAKNLREILLNLPKFGYALRLESLGKDKPGVLGKLGQALEKTEIYASPDPKSRLFYTTAQYQYLVVAEGPPGWLKVLMANSVWGYCRNTSVAVLPFDVTPKGMK